MESLTKIHHQPLNLSINPHRPSFSVSISSFRPPRLSNLSSVKIRASSSSSPSPPHHHQNPKPSFLKTLTPLACAAIAAAAFLSMRLNPTKPATAAPLPPATAETEDQTAAAKVSILDRERQIEEHLSREPRDIDSLRSLVEVKIRQNQPNEAVQVLDRLIAIEPEEVEWQLLKANVYNFMEENDLAATVFEEILSKDPFRVDAYHGLVMGASKSEEKLKPLMERVKQAMEDCKKNGKATDVRDFKLLIAQIRVMKAEYKDALDMYQELVKEEPRDFRPYLCQGIIYTLLKKKKEADKQFETFRKLIPKNHPYKEYFDDNMFATKLFGQTSGSNM